MNTFVATLLSSTALCRTYIFGLQDVTQKFRVGCFNAILRSQLEKTLNKYCSRPFYKTVHAEATLMGLISYLSSSTDARINYGQPLTAHELQLLEHVIDPVSPYVAK